MNTNENLSRALEVGTILNDKYIIESILGEGGFGITYACRELTTNNLVAIKEYFPVALSSRIITENSCYILPLKGECTTQFEAGRARFLSEANYLSSYHFLPCVASIYETFHENGTVYLVMEYIEGVTLKQYIKENGVLDFDELFLLFSPIIQALILLHKNGLLHRDLSPDNFMLGTDNLLHLLDFGAARTENTFSNKTMTVLLKSGYTPIEQYNSSSVQGPYTDVYALCATLYYCLTGTTPPSSLTRLSADTLMPLSECSNVTSWQAETIEKGLSIQYEDRFQTMEALYQALALCPDSYPAQNATPKTGSISKKLAPAFTVLGSILMLALITYYTAHFNAIGGQITTTSLHAITNFVAQTDDHLKQLSSTRNNPKKADGTSHQSKPKITDLSTEEPTPNANNSSPEDTASSNQNDAPAPKKDLPSNEEKSSNTVQSQKDETSSSDDTDDYYHVEPFDDDFDVVPFDD